MYRWQLLKCWSQIVVKHTRLNCLDITKHSTDLRGNIHLNYVDITWNWTYLWSNLGCASRIGSALDDLSPLHVLQTFSMHSGWLLPSFLPGLFPTSLYFHCHPISLHKTSTFTSFSSSSLPLQLIQHPMPNDPKTHLIFYHWFLLTYALDSTHRQGQDHSS